MAMGTTVILR